MIFLDFTDDNGRAYKFSFSDKRVHITFHHNNVGYETYRFVDDMGIIEWCHHFFSSTETALISAQAKLYIQKCYNNRMFL